uniref:CWF19-like protein 2 n=1 Tax=Lates calcarifer TaxID=8187 RepID=A0A4W6BKF3_LATCA
MAAHGVSFESSRSIEERKESKRQARQEALEKAKQQHEREERRKELKRQRGEDTWMLPEVNQRLEQIQEVRCKFCLFSLDEWMTFDFLALKTTSTAERRAEKERLKEEERAKAQAGLHKLELNPYWKDGGTGLPPEEMAGTAAKKGPVVNDGGLSWLRKSYQRMKEQAEREKRSLDDVVAERYGVRTDGTQAAAAHTFTFMIYQCTYGYVGKATFFFKFPFLPLGFVLPFKLSSSSLLRSESESEEEEEEEEEAPLLSEEEMNRLASELVPGRSTEDQEILLFRTDQSGRAWPVKPVSGPQEPHGGRRKKKPIETHVDGERVRYFQDDDNVGLQEMVRREKMSSAQDQNALYSRMAAKMMGKTDGDNYTLDDMFVSSAAQREGEGREEERMRSRAIGESRRLAASMEKCQHCFSSQELQKHLIVAIGSKVYLSLPAGLSMTEGHCLICPLQHHCSATGLDEDIWSEMQLFRRALVRMFESQELDCVFMETHMNPRRRQHMVYECIPLPRELGDMAPIYFKKAIMECDEEWAMNKKIVDLSSKDIRQAVPRGLPYFAVDFGLQGGYAHVIENEQKFPHYFGKEVVGGMMDLEPRRWRKLIRENFDDQRKKVLQFAQWWKPFDCTKTEG